MWIAFTSILLSTIVYSNLIIKLDIKFILIARTLAKLIIFRSDYLANGLLYETNVVSDYVRCLPSHDPNGPEDWFTVSMSLIICYRLYYTIWN